MRTLISCSWTMHGYAVVLDALAAAELVGIVPTTITVDDTWLETRLRKEGAPVLWAGNTFAALGKVDAFIAIKGQTPDDLLDFKIEYARKHRIPTAVWQL